MKVIDLLNKIANGEEVPKKIKYDNNIYEYVRMWEQYVDEVTEKPLLKEISAYNYSGLNNEVEIIEEEKGIPEKLGVIRYVEDPATALIHNKVDEIIDYLQSKGDE